MGDQNTIINEADISHILRRTTFGPTPKDLNKAIKLDGDTRGEAADYVLGFKRKVLKLRGYGVEELHNRWAKHLLKGKTPLLDKTVLFWHDHFSVATSVVDWSDATIQHVKLHYTQALGNFKDYVKAINKDPAMMLYLNTQQNEKAIPNENYARELCELFTIGVTDLNGVDNYTQDDVVQIARAFTGWRIGDPEAYLDGDDHDTTAEFPARGPKTLFANAHGFGVGGASFTVGGEGENEIDEVIDILFSHLDSDGENTVARRTAFRMLEFFAYANPDKTIVDEVVAASNFAITWDIEALVRAILVHDAFYETMEEPPFTTATKKSVKWPIDYAISTLRITRLKPKKRWMSIPGGSWITLFDHLSNMGQIIGEPPSVFGWNWEAGWISSSTLLARYTFARDIISARGGGGFRPDKLVDTSLTDPDEIADAVLAVLGVSGQFSSAERDELIDYLTDEGANPTLDLGDYNTRHTKLHGIFAMVMQSPAYQLN